MCHNDPHDNNMMIGVNEDGSPNPDSFQMIDFDESKSMSMDIELGILNIIFHIFKQFQHKK